MTMHTGSPARGAARAPLLARLRERTRAVHERLHRHPVLAPLMAPDLTRAGYVLALQSLQRFHEAVEAAPGWPGRAHTFSLPIVSDLIELGASRNPLQACSPLTGMDDSSAALGARYVLEGSAMGGQVIARNVADVLGWPEDAPGLSHFRRDGVDAGRHWRQFLDHLVHHCRDADACADGAARTFNLLERWLWQVHAMSHSDEHKSARDSQASHQ